MFEPIVIRFESTKTPGDIKNLVIDSIGKAVDVLVALSDKSELHELELDLMDYLAKIRNAQARKVSWLPENREGVR